MIKSLITFALLMKVWILSRIFFHLENDWIGGEPDDYAKDTRVIVILNHTSLYEPIIAGYAPINLLWKFARHGVLPVAEKTMKRRIGLFFSFLVRHPIVVTRQRDSTWDKVLNSVDSDAIVIILPEGRMKRANGLDSSGREMTIRTGIADILEALPDGRMLVVYSGGLHHVQVPGELLPTPFKTIRVRMEMVDIAAYKKELASDYPDLGFRKAVVADLTRRRDEYCPTDESPEFEIRSSE
ncbi:MAG: 1-acyl-sn-glycerol-3-phosphate acyltransferase [Acidobacteriota bacterium]|nr:1-acyl-sn-glycerol-3-phosphate acyltransferase [Acidobacteriota bacterium]